MIDLEHKADWTTDVRRAGRPHSATRSRRVVPGALVALAVLGLGLVAAPAVFGMFSRAPQGATMLHDFKPFMTEDRLAGFSTDIDTIDASVSELDQASAGQLSPSYAAFSEQWPAIDD